MPSSYKNDPPYIQYVILQGKSGRQEKFFELMYAYALAIILLSDIYMYGQEMNIFV
jgi:hypothetical protein